MQKIVSSADPEGLVVLGGGVAGLMASLSTNAPVYEADREAGGAVASDHCDGFTFDRGIHVLQTTNQRILDRLQDLGVDFAIVDRSAHIHAFGKDTAYPFQINSTNLPIGRRIHCVWAFLRRGSNPAPTDYAGWIYRSIGRGFGDTFLIPYSEKFWGVHPREMTFEWTENRVPKADVWKVLRGAVLSRNTRVGTNATFRYPRGPGGYGTVSEALRRALGDRLHASHCATRVDTERRLVHFDNGNSVRYRVLLSTIPLPILARIATGVPPEVREAVAALRTNSIMVVNLGIGRADITTKHWIHFPEKDIAFFRISFPHNFSPDLTPPGMSSVSCEVSYPTGSPPAREALIDRVFADLVRVGVLRGDDRIVVKHTRDIPFGYCIYDKARQAALPVIQRWLESVDIVPSGRYGLWTYFWSDEAMVSGEESAKRALQRLGSLSSTSSRGVETSSA
jgi:protoporphyrinogen oxidase